MRFTVHAVEQYIARHRPGLQHPAALAELQQHAKSALRLRDRTRSGDLMYLVPALGCRLVVKRERAGPVVVTILPAEESEGSQSDDLPITTVDPEQERRNALHALRKYLTWRVQRGDRAAQKLFYDLRSVGVLEG